MYAYTTTDMLAFTEANSACASGKGIFWQSLPHCKLRKQASAVLTAGHTTWFTLSLVANHKLNDTITIMYIREVTVIIPHQ